MSTPSPPSDPPAAPSPQHDPAFTDAGESLCLLDQAGALRGFNPRLTETLGWTAETASGHPLRDYCHPDERDRLERALADLDGWTGAAHVAVRLRRVDGTYLPCALELRRTPGGDARCRVAVTPTESTAESARYFELGLDLFGIIARDGHYLRVNPAYTRVLGWSRDELLALPSSMALVHPDDVEITRSAIATLLDGPGEQLNVENRQRTKAGAYKLISWSWKLDPETDLFYVAGRDITETRELLDELRQTKESAEQAMAVAEAASRARNKFLSNMSHELRTPLNGILGYAQLLGLDPHLSDRQREGVQAIQRSGDHLLVLINDMLDLAKMEAGTLPTTPSEVHLGDFLTGMASLFDARARDKRLVFGHEAMGELPPVIRCDETRLRQVLFNLISHALRQSEHGGVFLSVGFADEALRFRIEEAPDGVSSAHVETFFTSIERLGERGTPVDGTVLELPARLLEVMGGQLVVERRGDEGTVFWFEIAAEVVSGWTPKPLVRRVIEGYDGPRRTLLVADDKVENRRILARILTPLGFTVLEVENGEDAVRAVAEDPPDLILMDLVMPVLDGFEATRRIRAIEAGSRIPIIAMSASSFEPDRNRSRAAGCDGYLGKPVRRDKLLALLESHLGLTWRFRDPERKDAAAESPRRSPPTAHAESSAEWTDQLRHQLRAIHEAASIGDIRAILTILESVRKIPDADEAPGVSSLFDEVYRLAKRFQARKIKERVASLIEQD